MSDAIATYSFLPWLRQGLANKMEVGATENGRALHIMKTRNQIRAQRLGVSIVERALQ